MLPTLTEIDKVKRLEVPVSEGVMVQKSQGGGVPKYSAEWWKRVTASLREETTTDEHLPPSTPGSSLGFHKQARRKNGRNWGER
jgi:hypothetical protein